MYSDEIFQHFIKISMSVISFKTVLYVIEDFFDKNGSFCQKGSHILVLNSNKFELVGQLYNESGEFKKVNFLSDDYIFVDFLKQLPEMDNETI